MPKSFVLKKAIELAAMVEGLQELGIDAQALADGAIIKGGALHGGMVDSRGDHRIAMSFVIAGTIAKKPVIIKNCANVATSFPGFIEVAKKLNLPIEEHIDNVR